MWKCHKEAPCIAILNKQNVRVVFFYKVGEQEGRTDPVWRVGTSGRGEDVRKGFRRMNMVLTCPF
jgi:hypothetical protein